MLACGLLLCGLSGQTWAWAPSLLKISAMQGRLKNHGAAVAGAGMLGAGPSATRILPGSPLRGGVAGAISMGVPVPANDVGAIGSKLAVYDKTITQHQVWRVLSLPFFLYGAAMRPVIFPLPLSCSAATLMMRRETYTQIRIVACIF